ncbi:MAG: hypothetical protein WEE89_11935 [Gemmatimonadota bacterium]
MRIMHLAFALAVLPAGGLAAQASPIKPVCTADRIGERLLTSAQFPNGYRVDGPWLVVNQRKNISDFSTLAVTAVLDRIVEFDPAKEKRSIIPFPSAVEIIFKADSEEQILEAAAMVWCQTVNKARGQDRIQVPTPFRVSGAAAVFKLRA